MAHAAGSPSRSARREPADTRAPARRRTRRPRAEREAEILRAARAVFASRGYASATVAEIALRAGVVEGTLYSYFDSKQSLLAAVVRGFYESLIAETEMGLRAIRGAENQLRFLIRRHLDAFQAEPGLCRLVLAEARPDPAFYDQAVLDLNRRYTGLALAVVEAGRRAGELRDDVSPAVIRDLIYGGLEHAVWRHVFGDRDLDAERLADELANALLDGLALRTQATGEETMARLERAVARLENRVESGEPTPPIPSDRPSGGRP
ncbi:MAG: TetR/AcrR family transcriptional regulator [Myxococcota bacterium]